VSGGRWGLFPPETAIAEIEPLFPRVDVGKKKDSVKAGNEKKREAADEGLITFEQFKTVELRVGEITAAERVIKSDKLLKLTVLAHEKRTIVAGIAEHYSPEELIGKQVILVANMKPAKIMGLRSEGMLLAAKMVEDGKERLVLSTVSAPVKNGSSVA
jgi:methionyl-tRNA synthetase